MKVNRLFMSIFMPFCLIVFAYNAANENLIDTIFWGILSVHANIIFNRIDLNIK